MFTLNTGHLSGHFAMFNGERYFARLHDDDAVSLYSTNEPPPNGFEQTKIPWASGRCLLNKANVRDLHEIETTGSWQGSRFRLIRVEGANVFALYLGTDLDSAQRLPGMQRLDPYRVDGVLPLAEATDISQQVRRL